MSKVVMSLSGGMDSTTMLGRYLSLKEDVHCVHFQYGSKHNAFELESVYKVVSYYNVPLTIINMHEAFSNMSSHLMATGGDIPEGHYADANMSKTVVPGRNTIFASVLMGIAESVGANKIALGVHLGDHAIYPDCRREYIKALDNLVYLASDRKVEVEAPFQETDKTGICKVGMKIGVPYQLTRTCYKQQEVSCGVCGSCVERLSSFEEAGFADPIDYIDRETYKTFLVK
jgi:7-cyano-7-deazaguanine synthase